MKIDHPSVKSTAPKSTAQTKTPLEHGKSKPADRSSKIKFDKILHGKSKKHGKTDKKNMNDNTVHHRNRPGINEHPHEQKEPGGQPLEQKAFDKMVHGKQGMRGKDMHGKPDVPSQDMHGKQGMRGKDMQGKPDVPSQDMHGKQGVRGKDMQGKPDMHSQNIQGKADMHSQGMQGKPDAHSQSMQDQPNQASYKSLDAQPQTGKQESIGDKMLKRLKSNPGQQTSPTSDLTSQAVSSAPTIQPLNQETTPIEQVASPPPSREVNELIDKTVNRILVSSPEQGQMQEIRLQLDGKLLGGTEVRLFNQHGQLQIEFTPATVDAGRVLAQQQNKIQDTLRNNLNRKTIAVHIKHEQSPTPHQRVERKQETDAT